MSKADPVYKPSPGSIPHRVLSFLIANPDEELARSDIAVKFDTSAATVDTILRLPTSRGALVKTKNRDMELVWKLGDPAAVDMTDGSSPGAVLKTSICEMSEAFHSARGAAAAAAADKAMPFDSPIVESADDLLPDTDKTRRAQDVKKYWAWFDRFAVGAAAEFDRSLIRDVAHLAGKYGCEKQKEFRCSHGRTEAKAVIVRLS